MLRVARFPHSLNTTVVATQQVPTEHGSGRSPTTKLHLNGVLSWALSYHHGIQVIGHFWWKPRVKREWYWYIWKPIVKWVGHLGTAIFGKIHFSRRSVGFAEWFQDFALQLARLTQVVHDQNMIHSILLHNFDILFCIPSYAYNKK